MKKITLFMGLIIAMSALTNCNSDKMDMNPQKGTRIQLKASADTRTAIGDDLKTTWDAADELNVFLCEEGGTFEDNTQFTSKDASAGVFEGNVVGYDATKSYRWLATYPYNASNTAAASSVCIGSPKGTSQIQNGLNSMAHLSGKNVPLYGMTSAFEAGTPAVNMHHLAAFVRIKLKNTGSADMNITRVALTAPTTLTGTWDIDFTGDTPVYTEDATSTIANLTFDGGSVVLPSGQTADFYLAVKPFTANVGEGMEIIVVADNYADVRSNTVEGSPLVFQAGKIKTLGCEVKDKSATASIADGDYVIIASNAANDKYHALSSEASGARLGAVSVDYDSTADKFATDNGNIIWTIKKNPDGKTYTFKNGNNYLILDSDANEASTGTVGLNLSIIASSVEGRYRVRTTKSAEGEFMGNSPQRYLAKNSNAEYFAFYNGQRLDLLILPAERLSAMPVGTVLWDDDFSTVTTSTSGKTFPGSKEGFTASYLGSNRLYYKNAAIQIGSSTAGNPGYLELPTLSLIEEGKSVNVLVTLKAESMASHINTTININAGDSQVISGTLGKNDTALSTSAKLYEFKLYNVANTTSIKINANQFVLIDDLKVVVSE